MASKPPWLQSERVRLALTVEAMARIDGVAMRLGLSRGRVVDALVRVIEHEHLDAAVSQCIEMDARVLTAWRESETCIRS